MSRPATFKETDLLRAVKVMQKAGLAITGAEIDRAGTIRVLTGQTPAVEKPQLSELERWELQHGHGSA